MALDEGAVLVQVSWDLFLQFISAKPRTLQLYLHKVTPWRLFQSRISTEQLQFNSQFRCFA